MIKGYLLAHVAPREIMDAIESFIPGFTAPELITPTLTDDELKAFRPQKKNETHSTVSHKQLQGRPIIVAVEPVAAAIEKQKTRVTWTSDEKKTLREMYDAGASPSEIAVALGNGKTDGKVSAMAFYLKLGPWKHGNKRRLRGNTAKWKLGAPPIVIPGKTETIIDDTGQKITKCPPGYATGGAPQKNVGCKE